MVSAAGRAQGGEGRGDRTDPCAAARGIGSPLELENGDAQQQLPARRQVRGPVDLVAVDKGSVLRFEVLDADAIVFRSEPHVMAGHELVLEQRDARGRVAAHLDGPREGNLAPRLWTLDDLEHVVGHRCPASLRRGFV